MTPRAALLAAVLALAGCAGAPTADELAPPGQGVLQGVVFDEAIRPIEGATVQLAGQAVAMQGTPANGTFRFEGLAPGAYAVLVEKPGYIPAQLTAQVEAAGGESPLLKVQLESNPSERPYVEAFVFDGYIECGTSSIAVCAVPNFATLLACQTAGVCGGNVTSDRFNANHLPSGVPDWTQSELVWTATVDASDQFYFSVSHYPKDDPTALETVYNSTVGGSPLLLTVPGNATRESGLGSTEAWRESVFAGAAEGTTPPGCAPPCVGPGFAVQQSFTIYTHFFYRYQPPADWRFTEADVPEPPSRLR